MGVFWELHFRYPVVHQGGGLKPEDFPTKKILEVLHEVDYLTHSVDHWTFSEEILKDNETAKLFRHPRPPSIFSAPKDFFEFVESCFRSL